MYKRVSITNAFGEFVEVVVVVKCVSVPLKLVYYEKYFAFQFSDLFAHCFLCDLILIKIRGGPGMFKNPLVQMRIHAACHKFNEAPESHDESEKPMTNLLNNAKCSNRGYNSFNVSSIDFEALPSEECIKSSDEILSNEVEFILSNITSDSECSSAESTVSDVPLIKDANSEQPQESPYSIQHNVTHNCLSDLLRGLKDTVPGLTSTLPSDARTLLKTSKTKFCSKNVSPGKYIHIGLEKQLKRIISGPFQDSIYSFKLIINIDGISIFKSSNIQVLPILFGILSDINELQNKVFPIGLYCGKGKPLDMDSYLEEFVNEVNNLSEKGILHQSEKTIPVKVVAFCYDASAKADILGIKSFSRYNSCTRCVVKGETSNNRRIFTDLDYVLKTNEDFHNWSDTEFRKTKTLLTKIPGLQFNNSFVLDIMHLVYLGVTRTMILTWSTGNIPHKLSSKLCLRLSSLLVEYRSCVPIEINRKPRELKLLLRWKATEFRTFLLYLGPVVLKSVLTSKKYENFLTLHFAVTILLSSKMCKDSAIMQDRYYSVLLKTLFFCIVKTLSLIIFTLMTLITEMTEITDDSGITSNFTLETISAFQFENYLQKIKSMVRGYNKPAEQICNRLGECFLLENYFETPRQSSLPKISHIHCDGPLLSNCCGP
ncbi:hypothetical protein AGLY_006765 [Aphis glycines]|uniref:Uncharacterized protein n=1 Tax=Aphis glycines TaxID=307491 RepID=A0A6G0TQR2_APHGL|nr:hypothetical protein AGLY_006765 [Aphis glycines]